MSRVRAPCAGFAPLAITLTAVVYLHEPGAGGAWFIVVLEGFLGLQKRSPPLAERDRWIAAVLR